MYSVHANHAFTGVPNIYCHIHLFNFYLPRYSQSSSDFKSSWIMWPYASFTNLSSVCTISSDEPAEFHCTQ